MSEIISVTLWTAAIFAAIMMHLAVKPKIAKGVITAAVCLTGVGGLLIYGYGYACVEESTLLAVIKATFAVCRIFIGDNALSDIIAAPAFEYTWFHILFWLLQLMGLFSSTSAVISKLGAGVLRKLRLWLSRSKDVAIVYGLTQNTLDFARKLTGERDIALLFVDSRCNEGLESAVDRMGCLLRCDDDALEGTARFLKSLGLRSGSRRIWLYALDPDTVADQRYASNLLQSMEKLGIKPEQSSLTVLGPEDETDNRFQACGQRYGFGTVISVNEPEMVARMLVRTYPPCNTVEFTADGEAKQDFHALLIGFGQVGQAVLRQLVMNGQFYGSRMHIAVFAPNYEEVMGRLSFECGEMLEHYDIQFFGHDGRSRQLYQYLVQNAHSLRYIAVCAGSDAINAEISSELRTFLARRSCSAPIYLCSHGGIRYKVGDDKIEQHSIYTPDTLCSDRIDRMAMELNQTYCGSGSARDNWAACDYFSRMSSRASADFFPALLRMAGTTAAEAKNSWNPTGPLLENLARSEHMRWNAFHFAMGFRAMTREEFDARTEIYRAEVAEKGSSRYRIGKDLDLRIHACLIDWDALDELSARENAVTGKNVDYKQMDRNNVCSLNAVLHAMED